GSAERVLLDPAHPYTTALVASVVRIDTPRTRRLSAIPGSPPLLTESIQGCPFAPRCALREDKCTTVRPELEPLDGGRSVACWVASAVREARSA
ncbi:MAG TPA: oligopeptide/dipeptide ABC transporter ATP-binding protein, partial [Gaiellaceae bacterium]